MLILQTSVPRKHDSWVQGFRRRIVLTDSNQMLVPVAHLYVLSVGPFSFRNAHLSSVVGPSHVLAA
jgi:hypothetical protein